MTDAISRRDFLVRTAAAGLAAEAAGLSLAASAPASTAQAAPLPERPRLYFSAADLPRLRQRCEAGEMQQARAALLAHAETALKAELLPESYALGGQGQHGNYYAADACAREAIETCGFAYLLTQETRFADHARKALRHFAKYEHWTGHEFFTRDPAWHSALETAHFVRAYALGIDWLAGLMDAEERRAACAALARVGVEPLVRDWLDPATRIHALDSMGHNWWMVCVGAAGLGALALLGEDPRAEQWLAWAVDSIDEFFRFPGDVSQNKPRTFDSAGGFYESLGYANYTLTYYAYLSAALRQVFPRGWRGRRFDGAPAQLQDWFEFMMAFLYPVHPGDAEPPSEGKKARRGEKKGGNFLTPAFGDADSHAAFSGDVTLFLAGATGDGRYRWYFERFTPRIDGIFQMLFSDPERLPKTQAPRSLPLARTLHDIGWASLRDRWEDDATFLALKCGHTWNHAHADAASFVVFAAGQPLLIDPGTCSYNSREYRAYYTESIAHNTILVDGQGQPKADGTRGTKFPGRLYDFTDAPGARYILADATGPMAHACSRFLRHFLWLDDLIVLVDDVQTHKEARIDWLFHGQTAPRFEGGILSVTSGEARLAMNVVYPEQLSAAERKGYAPHNPGQALNYIALQQTQPAASSKFMAVLRAGKNLPEIKIERRQGKEWLGARLGTAGAQWELYCNLRADGRRAHNNSNQTLDEWETDGFMLAVREGNPRRLVLIDGSYLRRRDGAVQFDCFSKGHAVLTWDAAGKAIEAATVQVPPGSQVRLKTAEVPRRVMLNGQSVDAKRISREGDWVVIR